MTLTGLLVLAAALAPAQIGKPTLQKVALYFGTKTVFVTAPRQKEVELENYALSGLLYNKDKTQAAARWCYFWVKYTTCQITVISSNGTIRSLPKSDIEYFAFSPDNYYFAGTQTDRHALYIWDLRSKNLTPRVKPLINMRVSGIQTSPSSVCILGQNGGNFYLLFKWADLSGVTTQREPCVTPTLITPPT